jgi:hypothetical protein
MGSTTIDWPSLCSLFALAISAVTSVEGVKVLVGFSGDCGAGCFANATAATRVKAKLIIILRIKPPSVFRLASASYASPDLDTTICPRNQEEHDAHLPINGIAIVYLTQKRSPVEEMSFRFNNRKNPYLFRDTILKLIASSNIEYKSLAKSA